MNPQFPVRRLYFLSASFLFVFSIILTLSPAVRERSWIVTYRWDHWIGFLSWLILTWLTQKYISQALPDSDQVLFPIAALLSGWGLMTIWRLDPYFGARQTLWLLVSFCVLFIFLRRFPNPFILRNYKYVVLILGLIITAATLAFGTNPSGYGPRLWIGGSGIYFQPSEPLKLLLILYLSAYFSDSPKVKLGEDGRKSLRQFIEISYVVPTAALTGLALLILGIQRDLGTASLFLLLYSLILYLATGKKRILFLTTLMISVAGILGYYFINIIRARIEVWVNPWIDPSGSSYQIVQSLIAIANGGVFGRGIGIGSPSLVPVAISDFIYTTITEETGLLGAIALLILFCVLILRSYRIALESRGHYQRLLAGGLATYFGIQSLLILGGNLRLFPLTGINLPFVSYGGSSLLTSFIAVGYLLIISNQRDDDPAPLGSHIPYSLLAGIFSLGFLTVALATGWWSIIRGPDLLNRTDNARRSIADRFVRRGSFFDRKNQIITITELIDDEYSRKYVYEPLAPISGYTHPVFGQAGLESSLDGYLRGYQGNPSSMIWWHQLVYGTPPTGLDIRLSIDLDIQRLADELLNGHAGSIVLLNAESGEILAIASHPTFNPNSLDTTGESLQIDPKTPLVNRASQGSYPPGNLLDPLFISRFGLGNIPSLSQKASYLDLLGIYTAPTLRMPVGVPSKYGEVDKFHVSPLQIALIYSALSNNGIKPAPRIAQAVNSPIQGWIILPAETESTRIMDVNAANELGNSLQLINQPLWKTETVAVEDGTDFTWYVAGTLPNWQGIHLTLVVIIEENNPVLVNTIGQSLILQSLKP